jgi:hypothetical protein
MEEIKGSALLEMHKDLETDAYGYPIAADSIYVPDHYSDLRGRNEYVTKEAWDNSHRNNKMLAKQVYMSVSTPTYIAEMEDGSLRWVRPDFQGVWNDGPDRGWFDRGLKARSITWAGKKSIIPAEAPFLGTLNKALSAQA